MYTYIYIYRERERHTYIYTYTCHADRACAWRTTRARRVWRVRSASCHAISSRFNLSHTIS